MKRLQLSAIRQQVIACLQTNLVETILGVCFFIMFFIEKSLPYTENVAWRQMPFMFPSLFVLTYSCHSIFNGRKSWVYYSSLLSLVPLILLSDYLKNFIDSPAYGFTLILTAFLLLGYKKTADNSSFARHCVKLMLNAAFSVIIGLLLIGVVAAIYYSMVYIFDWSSTESFIEYVAHFVFYLFVPLFFCQQQQDDESDWVTLPKIVQFVFNFILSPGIIIYTAILYIYFLTIAIHWELPKGGVAYMVMAFITVSMLGRMSQLIVSQRYYDWFYRSFGFIAIPPLVLFWIGTMHRVYTYSLTESRVYLLAAGVLMTLYVFFLYSKRLGSYRLMLLISSVVIAVLTYIPGITARSIGIWAQAQRLEHLARQLSLWDDATGKLFNNIDLQGKDSTALATARELDASYQYLESQEGADKVIARYGANSLVGVLQTASPARFYRPKQDLDVAGYTRYLPGCRVYTLSDGRIEVKQRDRLLLEADLKTQFAPYAAEMDAWEDKQPTSLAPFCLRNDSCVVFLESIVREADGTYTLPDYNDPVVFCK